MEVAIWHIWDQASDFSSLKQDDSVSALYGNAVVAGETQSTQAVSAKQSTQLCAALSSCSVSKMPIIPQ